MIRFYTDPELGSQIGLPRAPSDYISLEAGKRIYHNESHWEIVGIISIQRDEVCIHVKPIEVCYNYSTSQLVKLKDFYLDELDDNDLDSFYESTQGIHREGIEGFLYWLNIEDRTKLLD